MKLAINNCIGGFNVKQDIIEKYNLEDVNLWDSNDCHTNKKLIELIELGIDCSGDCSELIVVEIPDESTDYYIDAYDGAEGVLYVVDGKIHRLLMI
jgi:hypothetical protein